MDTSAIHDPELDRQKRFITGNFAVNCINKCREDLQATSSPRPALLNAPQAAKHFNAEVAKLSLILQSAGEVEMDNDTKDAYCDTAIGAIEDFAAMDPKIMETPLDKHIQENTREYTNALKSAFNAPTTQDTWAVVIRESKKHAIPFEPAQG